MGGPGSGRRPSGGSKKSKKGSRTFRYGNRSLGSNASVVPKRLKLAGKGDRKDRVNMTMAKAGGKGESGGASFIFKSGTYNKFSGKKLRY